MGKIANLNLLHLWNSTWMRIPRIVSAENNPDITHNPYYFVQYIYIYNIHKWGYSIIAGGCWGYKPFTKWDAPPSRHISVYFLVNYSNIRTEKAI